MPIINTIIVNNLPNKVLYLARLFGLVNISKPFINKLFIIFLLLFLKNFQHVNFYLLISLFNSNLRNTYYLEMLSSCLNHLIEIYNVNF